MCNFNRIRKSQMPIYNMSDYHATLLFSMMPVTYRKDFGLLSPHHVEILKQWQVRCCSCLNGVHPSLLVALQTSRNLTLKRVFTLMGHQCEDTLMYASVVLESAGLNPCRSEVRLVAFSIALSRESANARR